MNAWHRAAPAIDRCAPALAFAIIFALAGANGVVAAHQPDVDVRPGREPEIIRTILLRKAACDRVQPGFRDLSANAFRRWRRFATQTIDAIEQSPEFKARLADVGRLPADAPGAQDRRDADAFCGDDFIGRIEALGRDPTRVWARRTAPGARSLPHCRRATSRRRWP